jgi:hypothetical protein
MPNPTKFYVTELGQQQPSASDLTDGTTGTGSVVLSASPALTGSPTAPTQASTDNSTNIATTAFVAASAPRFGRKVISTTTYATISSDVGTALDVQTSSPTIIILQNSTTTQLASDNFTRADSNPISGSWTSTGAISQMQIVSNQAECGTTDVSHINASVSTAVSWPNDGYSEITIATFTSATHSVNPLYRVASANGYSIVCSPGANASQIQRFVAGQGAASIGSNFTVVSGNVVRLTCSGTTISAQVNGSTVASGTDSNYASGSAGIGGYSPDASFNLDTISLWAGGNLLAPTVFSGFVQNNGSSTVTLVPQSGLINGAASIVLAAGAGTTIATDNTNFTAII